ncbi:MAG: ATP-binding protein [Candidatus Lokiarchaeota archaeon]|nr:ATP-binding protein [Candidatus Harpocratesius repetitus]
MSITIEQTSTFTSVGIVISQVDGNSPSVHHFAFLTSISPNHYETVVHQGQYCIVDTYLGNVVGIIEQIHILNSYFHDFQTVKNFNLAKLNLKHYFPSDEWEIQIVEVKVLGYIPTGKRVQEIHNPLEFRNIQPAGFPVKPGNEVYLLKNEYLQSFLGFDSSGLNIGTLQNYSMNVSLNLNKLFNKHVAILAQSGAGKSYLVSIMLEELLLRPFDVGTPGLIIIDLHGEYRFLKQKLENNGKFQSKIEQIQSKIQIINASFMQIGIEDMNAYDFKKYQPNISLPQIRELRRILKDRKNNNPLSNLNSLCERIQSDHNINPKVQETLIGWLEDLSLLNIFAQTTSPSIFDLVQPGKLTILDFSSILSMRKKQILVDFFSNQFFSYRRSKKIAPFILFLEEAHNFLPESGGKYAIAKQIFETLAREGRKFFAQLVLISQRPVRLSTTALSQCNTHIIMRITNPYDLNHIKSSTEALTSESIKVISSLPTGNAVILGGATNYPVFFKVRLRLLSRAYSETTLESESFAYMPNINRNEKKNNKSDKLYKTEKLVEQLNEIDEKPEQLKGDNQFEALDLYIDEI